MIEQSHFLGKDPDQMVMYMNNGSVKEQIIAWFQKTFNKEKRWDKPIDIPKKVQQPPQVGL